MDNHILIQGEEEGWVVGTGRVVQEMMKRHEVWYKFFVIDPVVKIVYPTLLTMLAAYLVWSGWIGLTPDISEHVKLSEEAMGIISLSIVFTALLVLTWSSYKIPIGSRIVSDATEEQGVTRRALIQMILAGVGVLIAGLTLLVHWMED